MNSVAKKLNGHFSGPNDMWIVERGKEREAALFQEAILEIEQLEADLDTANQIIDDEFEQKHKELDALINVWVDKVAELNGSIKSIRNAAKGLVTQIDKAEGDFG